MQSNITTTIAKHALPESSASTDEIVLRMRSRPKEQLCACICEYIDTNC